MAEKVGDHRDEFAGIMGSLRRLRHEQGKSQKDVAGAAKIGVHRIRKLESEIGRYALQADEARKWAEALGTDLDDLKLEAADFFDILPRKRGYMLVTYFGMKAGEEFVFETSPVRKTQCNAEREAAAWANIRYLADPSDYDETGSRPSQRSEIEAWVDVARKLIAASGDSAPEGLEELPAYAEALLEQM